MKPVNQTFQDPYSKAFTSTLHEIWPGTLDRQTCIKYNIQIPLDMTNHKHAHGQHSSRSMSILKGKNKKQCQQVFCDTLGIDHRRVNLAINTLDHDYLETIADRCLKRLEKMVY